jgi:hypothetical protein
MKLINYCGGTMLEVFARSTPARVGALFGVIVVIAAVITWKVMTPAGHQALLLKLARWVGIFTSATLLGAGWGWIKYSRASWGWATSVFAFLTFVLLLLYHPEIIP